MGKEGRQTDRQAVDVEWAEGRGEGEEGIGVGSCTSPGSQ